MPQVAVRADAIAHHEHDAVADGKPQAGADGYRGIHPQHKGIKMQSAISGGMPTPLSAQIKYCLIFLAMQFEEQGSACRIVFHSVGHNILQTRKRRFCPACTRWIHPRFQSPEQSRPAPVHCIWMPDIPAEPHTKSSRLICSVKLGMLQLAVLMEGIDQSGETGGFLVDGVQIFRLFFRPGSVRRRWLCVTPNHGNWRFQIVGMSASVLPVVLQCLALRSLSASWAES